MIKHFGSYTEYHVEGDYDIIRCVHWLAYGFEQHEQGSGI